MSCVNVPVTTIDIAMKTVFSIAYFFEDTAILTPKIERTCMFMQVFFYPRSPVDEPITIMTQLIPQISPTAYKPIYVLPNENSCTFCLFILNNMP